jgi:hypothetical protein
MCGQIDDRTPSSVDHPASPGHARGEDSRVPKAWQGFGMAPLPSGAGPVTNVWELGRTVAPALARRVGAEV